MVIDAKRNLYFSNDSGNVVLLDNPVRDYLLDTIISSPWCKCIKSDLAKIFRFPDLRVSEDALYNLDIFINAQTVYKLNSVLYIFNKTEANSLTRKVFNRKEFMKFHKSWVCFERKALRELQIENIKELLAGRKIKFSVLYYIHRIIINPDDKIDKLIIGAIRKNIFKNIILARSELSIKIKLFCFLFYFFPYLTIRLAVFYKIFKN